MDSAISSQTSAAHISASQAGLKSCQRSCRGIMLYFPPRTALNQENPYSWRSSEPVCLGVSAARKGPHLDLQKVHEAREVPLDKSVDFLVVLGHAVYQANIDAKVLPPGCMTGLEFLRFSKAPSNAGAVAVATLSSSSLPASEGVSSGASTVGPATLMQSAIKSLSGSMKAFASSFRILTSDADTNERLAKTWSSIVDFDPQQYANKFQTQAQRNYDAMSKWLRDLQAAVSKPKA